ncbi:MAG: cytochrome c [Phycisphaerales bacterium]|nr:cytochrome c [Phycisphaerales bacterium]
MVARFVVILVVTVASGCVRPPMMGHDASPAERHWVHDARIRRIMADLERQRSTSWPQEIQPEQAEIGKDVDPALDDVVGAADELTAAAAQIPEAVARVEMNEADRRAFQAQVETLADQAKRLRTAAANRDVAAIRSTLTNIETTCVSCHERFRDVSGPIR